MSQPPGGDFPPENPQPYPPQQPPPGGFPPGPPPPPPPQNFGGGLQPPPPNQPPYNTPHYPMPNFPQPISSKELRPSWGWYIGAGAIALLGIIVGIVGAVLFYLAAVPELDQEFSDGQQINVSLEENEKISIYVRPEQDTKGTCRVEGPSGIRLDRDENGFGFSEGNHTWQRIYDVTVDQAGNYSITCTGSGIDGLAIGEPLSNSMLVMAFVSGCGLPCVTIIIALVIVIITAARRAKHKKELLQQRQYGGPPTFPPPSPPGAFRQG